MENRVRSKGTAHPPPGSLLLAHHGTRRRYFGTQHCLSPQRSTHSSKLRSAERSRRPLGPGGTRRDLLGCHESARPMVLLSCRPDGSRNRQSPHAGPLQPRSDRKPLTCGVVGSSSALHRNQYRASPRSGHSGKTSGAHLAGSHFRSGCRPTGFDGCQGSHRAGRGRIARRILVLARLC